MRNALQSTYSFLMRMQGVYGIILVIFLGINLPNATDQAISIAVPIIFGIISLTVAVALVFPSLTPNWLGMPNKPLHLFPVLLLTGLFPLLFGILGMGAVILASIDEPLSRQLAIGLALPSVFLSGLMWWIGLVLCVWPNNTPTHQQPTEEPMKTTPAIPQAAPVDLRALRMSRMGSGS